MDGVVSRRRGRTELCSVLARDRSPRRSRSSRDSSGRCRGDGCGGCSGRRGRGGDRRRQVRDVGGCVRGSSKPCGQRGSRASRGASHQRRVLGSVDGASVRRSAHSLGLAVGGHVFCRSRSDRVAHLLCGCICRADERRTLGHAVGDLLGARRRRGRRSWVWNRRWFIGDELPPRIRLAVDPSRGGWVPVRGRDRHFSHQPHGGIADAAGLVLRGRRPPRADAGTPTPHGSVTPSDASHPRRRRPGACRSEHRRGRIRSRRVLFFVLVFVLFRVVGDAARLHPSGLGVVVEVKVRARSSTGWPRRVRVDAAHPSKPRARGEQPHHGQSRVYHSRREHGGRNDPQRQHGRGHEPHDLRSGSAWSARVLLGRRRKPRPAPTPSSRPRSRTTILVAATRSSVITTIASHGIAISPALTPTPARPTFPALLSPAERPLL